MYILCVCVCVCVRVHVVHAIVLYVTELQLIVEGRAVLLSGCSSHTDMDAGTRGASVHLLSQDYSLLSQDTIVSERVRGRPTGF